MSDGIVPLGNARVKVSANHALLVELSGGAAAMTLATITSAGIGVTSTDALVLTNTSAAAVGAQQMSGRIRFDGFGWKTDATASSQAVSVINELLPVEGAAAPTANFLWKYSVNGGAYSTILTLNSAGNITMVGNLTSNTVDMSTLSFNSATRVRANSPANGQLNLLNAAESAGVGLDVATDAVLKVRTRAQSAYATVDALAYQTGGNALNYTVSAYGAGTAYSLTNTAAAINLGTTDPAIVLDKAGTYLIIAQVHLAYTGATVVAETATIKVRRTNNTAADLSAVVVLDLPVATTLTNTYGMFAIPAFVYTTAAVDDAVTIFGNVSAGLGAGTIDATAIGTSIVALRIA